jgi:hypothetical protein
MRKEQSVPETAGASREALPKDASRLEMMRRVKRMSVEERLELFERMSRRVAWARSAKRLR